VFLVFVFVLLGLPLLGVAAVMLVAHVVLGITVWLLGGQLVVAALIFAGAVYYGRRHPIRR